MKYYKRLKKYKASNVEFYVESKNAYSYGWWKFVTLLSDGKTILFNNYKYSNSTTRHQSKVASVMHNLGLFNDDHYKIVNVSSPKSIGNHEFYKSCVNELQDAMNFIEIKLQSSRRKLSLDAGRYQHLQELQNKLTQLESIKHLIEE